MWETYPEIAEDLERVENYIISSSASRNRLLSRITNDLVGSGGKRLRPAFVILASKFGKYDEEKIFPLAGAIEILHMATLVHDDIVDRASHRRGQPTVSERYGIDMAVYTGDFLYTKAVLMLSRNVSSDKLDIMAKAVKIICEGEVDQFCERFDTNISFRAYLKRISKKTALMFGAACLLGADTGGCPQDVTRKLAKFGYYYGVAFQIRDDILDFLSDADAAGKPVGNDLLKGVITLPVIYTMARNTALKDIILKYSDGKHILNAKDMGKINRLITETGSLESSKEMLETYIKRGLRHLELLPDNKYRKILGELISGLKL